MMVIIRNNKDSGQWITISAGNSVYSFQRNAHLPIEVRRTWVDEEDLKNYLQKTYGLKKCTGLAGQNFERLVEAYLKEMPNSPFAGMDFGVIECWRAAGSELLFFSLVVQDWNVIPWMILDCSSPRRYLQMTLFESYVGIWEYIRQIRLTARYKEDSNANFGLRISEVESLLMLPHEITDSSFAPVFC